MILCVTLNPCLDKTLTAPPWTPGENVRGEEVRYVVGGKGNNVARALRGLGRQARPLTFLGGAVGVECAALLRRADGFDPLLIPTQAATREILTVRTRGSDAQSAFFDPNPEISPAEANAMLEEFRRQGARPELQAVTLSGSSPAPAADGLYAEMVALCRARGFPVLLDTYGPPLAAALAAHPDILKLNQHEAAQFAGGPLTDLDAVRAWALARAERDCTWAIVTAGAGPVVASAGGRTWTVTPPSIRAVNPIGSGDCMAAALMDGLLDGLDPEALLRWATAAAVANAATWDAGAISRSTVEEWVMRVRVTSDPPAA